MLMLLQNFWSIFFRFVGAGATAAITLIVLHKFGPAENGVFQYGLALSLIFSSVIRAGQDNLILKDVIANPLTFECRSIWKHVKDVFVLVLCFWFFLVIVAWAASELFDIPNANYLLTFIPLTGIMALLWIATEALRGLQYTTHWALWQNAFAPAAFLAILSLTPMVTSSTINRLPWLMAAIYLVALIFAVFVLRFKTKSNNYHNDTSSRLATMPNRLKQNFVRGKVFWLYALLSTFAGSVDIFILTWCSNSYTVGIFQPIIRIGSIIAVLINLVAGGFLAQLGRSYVKEDSEKFQSTIIKVWIIVNLISVIMTASMLIFRNAILDSFSNYLVEYSTEFAIYVLTQMIQTIFIIPVLLSPLIGLEKTLVKMQIVNVVMKILFISFGYYLGGLLGVIIGISAVTLILTSYITSAFLSNKFTKNSTIANIIFTKKKQK
jgi:O-antigen/teichoic acid export membrane protein